MKHERAERYQRAFNRLIGIIEVAQQMDPRSDGSILLTPEDAQRVKGCLELVTGEPEPSASPNPS